MALTKDHEYYDKDGDTIGVEVTSDTTHGVYLASGGAYVQPEHSVPLALNILGHDRPVDERVSTGRFEVGDAGAFIADSQVARDRQVDTAAALLTAADAYDKRVIRLATAEKRRQQALESLADSFARVNKPATEWTGDDVGKLREALGRYDAALAN